MKPFSLAVNGYLYDYKGGIAALRSPHTPDDYLTTAKRLCELSRDIYWTLGDVAAYDPDYIRRIAELFDKAVAVMTDRAEQDATIQGYLTNIKERRDELTSGVTAAAA